MNQTPDTPTPRTEDIRQWLHFYHGECFRLGTYDEGVKSTVVALLRELAAVTAQRDEAVRALKWQPIETAPKDGTFILVGYAYYPRMMQVIDWVGEPHNCWRGGSNPTHWMPLPEPPLNETIQPLSNAK